MITRRAILLKYSLSPAEECRIDFDFTLVQCFLKSASGGCFEDEEILKYSIDVFDRESLFELFDSYDYTFIYFSGHSYFYNRQIEIPLKNNQFISESEFIRPGKKQWIFMECSRSNTAALNSTELNIPRKELLFQEPSPELRDKWENVIYNMEPFYLIYFVTKIGGFAFNNEHGGKGTQLFFMSLMRKLLLKKPFNYVEFVKEINKPENAIQQSCFIPGNLDLNKFSTLF
jgi:hypothetical protein